MQVPFACMRERGADGMVGLHLFYQHFIEADQKLACFVFFFLIPTSQSLLFEQALTSQLLWGKCVAYKAVWKLQVADLHEKGMGSV